MLGTAQGDAIKDHHHLTNGSWAQTGFDLTGGVYFIGSDAHGSHVPLNLNSGAATNGGAETRGPNTAFAPRLIAY